MRWAFRIIHRFTRPLKCDECEDNLLEDLFGLDSGAVIGLEYRFGMVPGGQAVRPPRAPRQDDPVVRPVRLTRQTDGMPVESRRSVAIEGTDNFREDYSPAVGAVIVAHARRRGRRATSSRSWSNNANLCGSGRRQRLDVHARHRRPRPHPPDGLSGRRVDAASRRATTPDSTRRFAIEKRAGGHIFQLNFSNVLRERRCVSSRAAAPNGDHWYMGFNISRKFF